MIKNNKLVLSNKVEDIIFKSFIMYLLISLVVSYGIILGRSPIDRRIDLLISVSIFLLAPSILFVLVKKLNLTSDKKIKYYSSIMIAFYILTCIFYFNEKTSYTNVLLAINLMILLSITMKRKLIYIFAFLTFIFLVVSIYFKEDNIIYYTSIGVLFTATYACTQIIKRFKAYVLDLMELNENLEIKVEERTTELSSSNQELIALLEDLENTQLQLIESEKIGALGKIVSGVAHEINTPVGVSLTSISYLRNEIENIKELLNGETVSKTEIAESIECMSDSAKLVFNNINRTITLIDEFKKMSPYKSVNKTIECNIGDIVDKYLKDNEKRFEEKNIEVIFDCEEINVSIAFDNIIDILSNLVENSITHGFKDSKEGEIIINIVKVNDTVKIEFTNNGHSIDENVLNQMFDPFFTTIIGNKNSGLGLSIVHSIVVGILNGSIEVINRKEGGVTFTISFPMMV